MNVKNISSSLKSYISIVVLATALYLGFDTLFNQVKSDTSKEVVIASLGAIFLVLATKFLMEKESENRLAESRRSSLFKDNLNDYRVAADSIMRILKDDKINPEELHRMREVYAKLVLLGSQRAVIDSRRFIERCYHYLESDDSNSHVLKLTSDQSQELWGLALDFLASARNSLKIDGDGFDLNKEKISFASLNKRQYEVEIKYQARQELVGGVAEWVRLKQYPPELTTKIQELTRILTDTSPTIQTKCSKTQISFFDSQTQDRIMYLNSYRKARKELVFTLNGRQDKEFFSAALNDLSAQGAQLRELKREGKYDLKFSITITEIHKEGLRALSEVTNKYIRLFSR